MEDDYVLHEIFNYLPPTQWIVLESVSQTWASVLRRQWRSIKSLRIGLDLFQDDAYPKKLSERQENLVCHILKRCGPNLVELRFAPVNVREQFFRNVRRFSARHELSDKVLRAVCEYCGRLKILDLSYHSFPNWETFELLQNLPPSLETLLLEICRVDDHPPTENAMTNLTNACFNRLRNLKMFSLWGSCYGYLTVTDVDFHQLPTCTTFLDLSQGFAAKINTLHAWIPRLIDLQQLHLDRTSISDQDVFALVQTCRTKLVGLTLAYAKEIRDFSLIASFSKLRYLRLDGNRDFLNDQALNLICQSCPDLRQLSLENCSSLTSASLEKISQLQRLHYLSVCSILSMNDDCLVEICKRCLRLSGLQLKYCKKLSRRGLVHLPNLRSLRYLGVSGLSAFDQSIAECVRLRCPKLCTIEAFNCENYY